MDDPAFPSTVDTQTGAQTTTLTTPERSGIGLNINYVTSIPGILKVVELLFGLIVWACVASYTYAGGQHWVMFVAVTSWLFTLLYFIFCLLSLRESMPVISGFNWNLIETVYSVVVTFLYFIAACVQAGTTGVGGNSLVRGHYSTYAAAAAFAFLVTIAYGVDAFFAFQSWRGAGGQLPSFSFSSPSPQSTPATKAEEAQG
ncbi:PREDICTED: plasmolipin-like [Branchiostoma belcheri]|uniref:Plasmolipin-like n=1 Tax=Branchiostoma belcheri TaxID=7741 RepID=A0A6P4YQD1_BRABE|nr:PREDICTED: plasmolipin-like [Branchiostoma belcheri]